MQMAVLMTLGVALPMLGWQAQTAGFSGLQSMVWIPMVVIGIAAAFWLWVLAAPLGGAYEIVVGPAGVSASHTQFGLRVGEKTVLADAIHSVTGGQVPGSTVYSKAILLEVGLSQPYPLLVRAGLRTEDAIALAESVERGLGLARQAEPSE
jgi:hypothetical protein